MVNLLMHIKIKDRVRRRREPPHQDNRKKKKPQDKHNNTEQFKTIHHKTPPTPDKTRPKTRTKRKSQDKTRTRQKTERGRWERSGGCLLWR